MKKYILTLILMTLVVIPAISFGATSTSTQLAILRTQLFALQKQILLIQRPAILKCPFKRDLSLGQGVGDGLRADVVLVQNALRASGYLNIAQATGSFGPMTQASIRRWQRDNGLTPTGKIGPSERLLLCGNSEGPSATTTIWQVAR